MVSGFGASGFQASGQVLFEPGAEGSALRGFVVQGFQGV